MGVRAVLFVAAGAIAAATLAGYATGAAGPATELVDDVLTRADEPPPEKQWKPVKAKRQKPRSGFRERVASDPAQPAPTPAAEGPTQPRFEGVLEKRSQTSAREAIFAERVRRARASNARARRAFRGRVASEGRVTEPVKAQRPGFRARVERQRPERAKGERSRPKSPFVKRVQRGG